MQYIFPLILLVASGLVYFNITEPMFQDVKKERARVVELDDALANSKKVLALRDALLNEFNSIPEKKINELEVLVPSIVNPEMLALEVERLASRNNLRLTKINVKSSKERAGAGLGPQTTKATYQGIDVALSVNGTYPSLRRFLSDAGRSLRLFDTRALFFSSPQEGSVGAQDFSMTLRTYQLK